MRFVRRFGRILWATFAGVSLLLCAAVVALWVRGYSVSDVVARSTANRQRVFSAGSGWLHIIRMDGTPLGRIFGDDPTWRHYARWPTGGREDASLIWAKRWDVDLPGFRYASRTANAITPSGD